MKEDRYQRQPSENWNETLDRDLKNLPERPAPADLAARVMSQVNAQVSEKRRRHLRLQLPLWLRTTAGVMLLAVIVWLSLIGARFYETRMSPALDRGADICRTVFGSFASALGGIPIGFNVEACRFIFLAVSLLLLGMYVTCIGVGTIIYRTVRR
jgi:hypothetical protein